MQYQNEEIVNACFAMGWLPEQNDQISRPALSIRARPLLQNPVRITRCGNVFLWVPLSRHMHPVNARRELRVDMPPPAENSVRLLRE
jgi:hypothetical protein